MILFIESFADASGWFYFAADNLIKRIENEGVVDGWVMSLFSCSMFGF
jgi:hypothetical protein